LFDTGLYGSKESRCLLWFFFKNLFVRESVCVAVSVFVVLKCEDSYNTFFYYLVSRQYADSSGRFYTMCICVYFSLLISYKLQYMNVKYKLILKSCENGLYFLSYMNVKYILFKWILINKWTSLINSLPSKCIQSIHFVTLLLTLVGVYGFSYLEMVHIFKWKMLNSAPGH
jgi:hypothetical protein